MYYVLKIWSGAERIVFLQFEFDTESELKVTDEGAGYSFSGVSVTFDSGCPYLFIMRNSLAMANEFHKKVKTLSAATMNGEESDDGEVRIACSSADVHLPSVRIELLDLDRTTVTIR